MNVNIKFQGMAEKIVEEAIRQGYASTKTEALRLGVLELNNHYKLLEKLEDEEDIRRADEIVERIESGKEKLHSEKEIWKALEHKTGKRYGR